MLKDFKAFLFRGNLLDLAVAVVIGIAFGAVITSLVTNLITPLIAAIIGQPSFRNLFFTLNGSKFRYGAFLDDLLRFIFIAAAVFFFVVKPATAMMNRMRRGSAAGADTRACPECLSVIPIAARRCAFCTAEVAGA